MSENMYVYILTNQSQSTFYTGVTNNLERRILEHKQKLDPNSFSARYNLTKLVYYETDGDSEHAILREKQIKNYRRENSTYTKAESILQRPLRKLVQLMEDFSLHFTSLEMTF